MDETIPASLSSLTSLNPNWKTGPEVVAGVRNRLVHPSKKDGGVAWDPTVLVEAWTLISLYLERALLRRLSVRSKVRKRLDPNVWVGAVETPPWAVP
jgi:hypothetical protein